MNSLPTTNSATVLVMLTNEKGQIAKFILNDPVIQINCGAVTITAPNSTPIWAAEDLRENK